MVGHEDVDLFTLLPAPSSDGLQALNPRTGRWVNVHAPPGSIIVNSKRPQRLSSRCPETHTQHYLGAAGDYAQLLFNDRFPSTTHRVTPPPAERSGEGRTSCPMAIYLPEDFVLEPLPECGEARYAAVDCLTFHTSTNRKYYGEGYRASGADGDAGARL